MQHTTFSCCTTQKPRLHLKIPTKEEMEIKVISTLGFLSVGRRAEWKYKVGGRGMGEGKGARRDRWI